MKIVLIIVAIIIYLIIGYVIGATICAIEETDDFDAQTIMIMSTTLWVFLLPLYVVSKLVVWLGKKIAFIPVLIVGVIKARKEGD